MTAQPFYLLGDRAGWRPAGLNGLVLTGDPPVIELSPLPGPPTPLGGGDLGGLTPPAAIAVGADDLVYLLDAAAGLVRRLDPCTGSFETLPCTGGVGPDPRQVDDPHGIAVSRSGDLWIADTGNRRLQVFGLLGLPLRAVIGPIRMIGEGQTRRPVPIRPPRHHEAGRRDWPDGTWEPWDVVMNARGTAYVSDRLNGLIHVFDRDFEWRAAWDGAGPTGPLHRPTRLATDTNGRLYVVQEDSETIVVLAPDGGFLEQVTSTEQLKGRFRPAAVAVDDRGVLYVHDSGRDRIHLFCRTNNETFSWTGAASATPSADVLTFDRQGNAVQVDRTRRQVMTLPARARFASQGVLVTEPFDSQQPQCRWDRIRMFARVPDGTEVRVDTLTSESVKTAAEIQQLGDRWATGQVMTVADPTDWDCTVLSPPGRYLWLRLTITGGGQATPSVERVEIFYPRATSIAYLPAVYQEDPEGTDFLARFLSIFDSIRNGIAGTLEDFASYLDAGSAPASAQTGGRSDFLTWLASWIGLTLDAHWPLEKRRRLLENAARLYALRGTPEGLRLHLRLYLDAEPRVLEHFHLRRWMFLGDGRLGDCGAIWGPEVMRRLELDAYSRVGEFQLQDDGDPVHDPLRAHSHRFTVFVPATGADDPTQRQALERVVALAKPAHTAHIIEYVYPRFRVGLQALIGVDSVVGRYPAGVIEGHGSLGSDTVLGLSAGEAMSATMRVGSHSRIGSTTVMD